MIEECLVVDIRIVGDGCPLAHATETTGVTINSAPPLLRRDGNALLRFSTQDDHRPLTKALDGDDRIRFLHRSVDGGVTTYRCLSLEPCVLHELTDAGFLLETLQYSEGEEYLTGSVVGATVLEGVLAAAGDAIGAHIERIQPLGSESAEGSGRQWDLTERQEIALRQALEAGYFAIPREATATEEADMLGISKSAFLERLRRGQRSLLTQTVART